MSTALLPTQFADLEPFAAEWSVLPTLEDRLLKRLNAPMDELQAFYDAVFPRAEEAMVYLDPLPVDDLTDEQHNLMKLLYSLSVVGVAVEVFSSQKDPNVGDTWIYEVDEPAF